MKAAPAFAYAYVADVTPPEASKANNFDGNAGWYIHVHYEWVACRDYLLRVGTNGTDASGNIYGAEVGPKALKKYVKK